MGNIVSTLNAIQLSLCFAPVADGNSSAHVQRHHKTHWLFYLFVLASIFPPRCLVPDFLLLGLFVANLPNLIRFDVGRSESPTIYRWDIIVKETFSCECRIYPESFRRGAVRIANNKHVNNNSFANVNSVGNGRHLWLAVEMDFLFLVNSESNFLLSMVGIKV